MNSKTEWVNFKEIKENVGIEDVLDHYGLLRGLKREKDNLVGYSLCSENHRRERSFWVDTTENTWHCFSCGESGNILDFAALMEGVSTKLAALLLQKWFGIICDEDRKLFKEKS